ncbi:hypothetical protein R3W88_006353 [Solanum pinnatisectum]|uniref:Uncharacterized protein n=1 Tax=Solanum pinnatisectum TaxID=50273 RepID=A0AAV9KGW1_9SOLN|nr:hypothetical protein R3W88_006353 [Solanum pinnatisectum]
MFRALSTRRNYRGYDELIKEEAPSAPLVEPKLNRNTSVPAAKFFSPSRKVTTPEQNFPMSPQVNKETKKASKIHPIFSLFETKKKKKATARPEFSRYIQYVREGGFGDVLQTSSVPPTHHGGELIQTNSVIMMRQLDFLFSGTEDLVDNI